MIGPYLVCAAFVLALGLVLFGFSLRDGLTAIADAIRERRS